MSTQLATTETRGQQLTNGKAKAFEMALMKGDLSQLDTIGRLEYYRETCESLGLNPLTKPFDWLLLQGKLTLYSNRNCMDQLRKIHGVSVKLKDKEKLGDLYSVGADATDRTGRSDESTGVVVIAGLKGNDLANAMMKAETKAKNRVTKSICGLGFLDESELDTVKGYQRVSVDFDSRNRPPQPQSLEHGGVRPVVQDVPQDEAPEEVPTILQDAFPGARVARGEDSLDMRERASARASQEKAPSEKAMWKLFFDMQNLGHEWPRAKKQDQLNNIAHVCMLLSGDEKLSANSVSVAIKRIAEEGLSALDSPSPEGPIEFADDEVPF